MTTRTNHKSELTQGRSLAFPSLSNSDVNPWVQQDVCCCAHAVFSAENNGLSKSDWCSKSEIEVMARSMYLSVHWVSLEWDPALLEVGKV